MTSPWPDSPLLSAITKLRRMVALSPAFLTRAAITYEEALERVWTEYVPGIDELIEDTQNQAVIPPVSPFASIWPMSTGFDMTAGGSQVFVLPEGMMHLYLACEPLESITGWNERREESIGFLDQWMKEIMGLSGSGVIADDDPTDDGEGYLTITKAGAALIDHTPFKERASLGDFFFQSVALKYGDQA